MTKRRLEIGSTVIEDERPTYLIADIGANHDGCIKRAKDLIRLAAEAGANAVKFQHFEASTIVSDRGFKELNQDVASHQKGWTKSVFETYLDASINQEWTQELFDTCCEFGVDFMTTTYSQELTDRLDKYLKCYKVGSGDLTWHEHILHIAGKGKPYILALGASCMNEINTIVDKCLSINKKIALLQCNTNYTGSDENFANINLRVISTLRRLYPEICIGLSDHTKGAVSALGAVALGGRIIEKHFTDNCSRQGPDHAFAMDPDSWNNMTVDIRNLERSLGNGVKVVEDNELETVILQRRSLCSTRTLYVGEKVKSEDLIELRPCPKDAIEPFHKQNIIGRYIVSEVKAGRPLKWTDVA